MSKKILCFHGFGTNSDVLSFQLKQFKQSFKNIEFITLNGPIQISKNNIVDEKLAKLIENQNIYSWGNFLKMASDEPYKGMEPGINAAIKVLKQQGPFHGIMGFSQGSHVVACLAMLYEMGELKLDYQLNCFIFVSGMPSQLPYGKQPIVKAPSLHFIGLNDFLVDRSIGLTSQFLNPLVIYHNQGHKIPTLTYEQIKQVNEFFENKKQDWSQFIFVPKL
ncbi:hypothetical protein pb186bvf_014206 [Paramecium bursaria]